jgi:hypothetical protein
MPIVAVRLGTQKIASQTGALCQLPPAPRTGLPVRSFPLVVLKINPVEGFPCTGPGVRIFPLVVLKINP